MIRLQFWQTLTVAHQYPAATPQTSRLDQFRVTDNEHVSNEPGGRLVIRRRHHSVPAFSWIGLRTILLAGYISSAFLRLRRGAGASWREPRHCGAPLGLRKVWLQSVPNLRAPAWGSQFHPSSDERRRSPKCFRVWHPWEHGCCSGAGARKTSLPRFALLRRSRPREPHRAAPPISPALR